MTNKKEDIEMVTVEKKDGLALVLEENGLEIDRIKALTESFGGYFRQAGEIANEAKNIVITEENQIEEMQLARGYRIQLKDIRLNTDKKRKVMKEKSLREGRAIDGAANIIKALVVPIEEHLLQQEKFLEIKREAQREQLGVERSVKLQKFVEDISVYQLKDMSDPAFEQLLKTSKLADEAQKEAESKAEEKRIAKERSDAEEQKLIKEENEKLKVQAKKDQEKQEKEREEREKALAIERKKVAAEKAKQEAIIKKEREEREKIEATLKAEKEAQEQKRQKEEEMQKKALLAPDKQKLISFASFLDGIEIPNLSSRDAGQIMDEAQDMISQTSKFLREQAKKL